MKVAVDLLLVDHQLFLLPPTMTQRRSSPFPRLVPTTPHRDLSSASVGAGAL